MRALPRVKASPAFKSEVFRAMETQRRPAFAWRFAAAFAMTVVLIGVVQMGVLQYRRQQQIQTLRAEQQKIQAELAAVKKSVGETEPVVVLENDKGARVIMDLDSAVQQASYRSFD